MAKYHVSNKTGKVSICQASIKSCPYPSDSHFRLKSEAVKYSDAILKNKFDSFTTFSKTQNIAKSLEDDRPKGYVPAPLNIQETRNLYSDDTITNTTLSILSSYKKPATIFNVMDNMAKIPSHISRTRALLAIAKNTYVNDAVLIRIVAMDPKINRDALLKTKNKRMLEFALISSNSAVRKIAMQNENVSASEAYNVILRSPGGNYNKETVRKIENYGPISPSQELRKEVSAIRSLMSRINHTSTEIKEFSLSNEEKVNKLAQKTLNNLDLNPKTYDYSKKYVKYYATQLVYAPYLTKHIEIEKTRKYQADNEINKLEQKHKSKKIQGFGKVELNTVEHEENDYSKLEQFKNTKPMASYEDAIELQERWDKGIHDLPIEIQHGFLNKKYDNIESGLRAVVDLFRTSDTKGQMVKSGLNNFVNHIEQLKEKKRRDGYIAIDEPEFMTPMGKIKVEEHIGNFDYGERIIFRINGEKFEMGKPMRSDRWTSFIHIYEESLEESQQTVKKGFWARLFSRNNG